jgi:flagellar hook-associated protein 2
MAGTITFTGMSADMDLNQVIDALVSARRQAHIQPLEDWKTLWETKQKAVNVVDSTLASFYSTIRGMDRINEFLTRTATSSTTGVLTVAANSEAVPGTHTIVANQLAQSETEVHRGIQNSIKFHAGVADQTDPINSSGSDKTFIYSYGGTTRTITVHDTDTLQNLRDDINADPGNPGVTAKIVTSGGQDHLVLVETTPDAAKVSSIDPDGDMTLDGTDDTTNLASSTFSETVNASGSDKILQLKYGTDAAVNITVTTGTTLEGLRNLINASPAGVRAWILDDGGTGSGARHLVLSGENTGEDYTIQLNSGGATTLDGTSDTENFTNGLGIFTETATARNAQFRLDGYPAGTWIERTTNHITDALNGVTMDLVAAGTATVTVGTDKTAVMEKVEAFREGFNQVRAVIINATMYDSETGETGPLLGNYALQIVKSRLDNLASEVAPGFRDPDDPYVNLQQLGFATDAQKGSETEGLLLLDTSKLSAALDDDPDAVAKLFSTYFEGLTNNAQVTFYSSLSTATPGIYDVEVDTNTQQGRFRLQGGDWGDWTALSGTSGNYYLTGTTAPERGLALYATYASGTGTHSAEVRLRNGVFTQISAEMGNLLSSTGPLETLTANYSDIIDNTEARIAAEERRLTQYEELLKLKYARLDAYLSKMNSTQNYLTQWSAKNSGS